MENEEKNMIKILSYVSKINKTQKNMNKVLTSKMKNIKFKYEEEKNDIKYEEYIFNGIAIPKDIEFKYISNLSINISWNIDDINKDDKDKIKYRIEMKKENEEFEKIYEGNNNNYSINNLSNNTNYEFRICSLLDNIMGEWSEIKKFKTIDFDCDSIILIESKRGNEYLKKIYEWSGYNKMELLFRGTRDGMTNIIFHNKCDKKGQTITLIKNEKGNIFGGYSSISWTSDSKEHSAPDSFLFTLTNNYNIEPTKFVSKNDQREVYHRSDYGPIFGGGRDLGIYPDISEKGGWSNFPNTYPDILGKGKSIFTGDINKSIFKIKEIEVFKLFK